MPATHGHERFGLAVVRTTAQHDAQTTIEYEHSLMLIIFYHLNM